MNRTPRIGFIGCRATAASPSVVSKKLFNDQCEKFSARALNSPCDLIMMLARLRKGRVRGHAIRHQS
jgi:hypothetical protein